MNDAKLQIHTAARNGMVLGGYLTAVYAAWIFLPAAVPAIPGLTTAAVGAALTMLLLSRASADNAAISRLADARMVWLHWQMSWLCACLIAAATLLIMVRWLSPDTTRSFFVGALTTLDTLGALPEMPDVANVRPLVEAEPHRWALHLAIVVSALNLTGGTILSALAAFITTFKKPSPQKSDT